MVIMVIIPTFFPVIHMMVDIFAAFAKVGRKNKNRCYSCNY